MTELADNHEELEPDLTEEAEPGPEDVEAENAEADTEEPEADSEDGGETVVTIGDDAPPPDDEGENSEAPEWVKGLRKKHREEAKARRDAERRAKELEQKLAEATGAGKPAELGPKPTLENADYDSERFEQELLNWHEQKRKHDEAKASQEAEREAAEQEWQERLEKYQQERAHAGAKFRDFDDAESVAQDVLSDQQRAMIVDAADDPTRLIYALGKNPDKAKELANIKNPVKFAFAVAKLETTVRETTRKAPPKPESKLSGAGRVSGSTDATLAKLEAEAEKTGDRTAVIRYKSKLKKAGKL